jgi:hypothetical protein
MLSGRRLPEDYSQEPPTPDWIKRLSGSHDWIGDTSIARWWNVERSLRGRRADCVGSAEVLRAGKSAALSATHEPSLAMVRRRLGAGPRRDRGPRFPRYAGRSPVVAQCSSRARSGTALSPGGLAEFNARWLRGGKRVRRAI